MRITRFLILTLGLATITVSSQAAGLVNGIYAVVNDSVITYDEVESSIAPLVDILDSQYHNNQSVLGQKVQETRANAIEELVERQLILAEFKTAGYQLPESFVDDSISRLIKDRYGDRAKLTRTLQSEGITYEEFRKRERDRIIVQALTEQHISAEKILISPHKIEIYYNDHKEQFKTEDEIHLRMIELYKTGENGDSAKKLAAEIAAKLDEGTPFAEMASIYSQGSYREKGGDRGWVEKKSLATALGDAAFALNAGQHTIVDMPKTSYVVFVEEKRAARIKPMMEAREEIEKSLRSQEGKRLKERWISRLKTKAYVRYY